MLLRIMEGKRHDGLSAIIYQHRQALNAHFFGVLRIHESRMHATRARAAAAEPVKTEPAQQHPLRAYRNGR